jgi:hypothetical protein
LAESISIVSFEVLPQVSISGPIVAAKLDSAEEIESTGMHLDGEVYAMGHGIRALFDLDVDGPVAAVSIAPFDERLDRANGRGVIRRSTI